jgi:AcrR family transcriptional regulator
VDEQARFDTRARILAAALELFLDQGYQRGSLRQIADRLRLTKAAILYHFPSKAHILAALTEPLTEDFETVIEDAAALSDPGAARRAVVEGALEVYLTHRGLLRLLFQDVSLLAQESGFQDIIELMRRGHEIVAGPGAGLSERIRAAQVFSVLGDPVMFFADAPTERLRREVLAGARLLLGDLAAGAADAVGTAGATAPVASVRPIAGRPAAGRRRAGRPRALSGDKAAAARRMYAAGTHSVTEIAAALGVSRATVYRHLRDPESV